MQVLIFINFFLGDPDDLVATGTDVSSLEDWRDLSALNLLYLNYDVTPASLVDAIITEISVIPCTSGLSTNTIFQPFNFLRGMKTSINE